MSTPIPRFDIEECGLGYDSYRDLRACDDGDWVKVGDHLRAIHEVGLHWCARMAEQDAQNAEIRSAWEVKLKGELAALQRRHATLLLLYQRATGTDPATLDLDKPI